MFSCFLKILVTGSVLWIGVYCRRFRYAKPISCCLIFLGGERSRVGSVWMIETTRGFLKMPIKCTLNINTD